MSACSHGILAISIQLHKKGASPASVVSFLLASPWANMTLTIMLIGFFGAKALFILLSAIIIAIVTGLIFQILESKKLIEENPNMTAIDEGFSIVDDLKKRMKDYKFTKDSFKKDFTGILQGTVALGNMVLWWILIGIGLASFASAYVPSDFFTKYMGANLLGLFVTLIFATVIEVCSEGSAPMAFELFRQTAALGNSFVFLMAGVVTDYTEIGLIWQNIGKKTAIWLPVVAVPQVLLLGYLANLVF
ncbi:MAG: permease [Sedimentisphaerales bacterium]|nr:permease [Sedimentisphaerales bacterium]